MFNEPIYRAEVFKKVFETDTGKLVLGYLEAVYTAPANFDNDKVTYYGLGKRDVLREIRTIISKKPKETKQ